VTDGAGFSTASYIFSSMRTLRLMEDLLAIEAETKFLLTAKDRSHEQTLMQELLRIFKEAERLLAPERPHINCLHRALLSVLHRGLISFRPCEWPGYI